MKRKMLSCKICQKTMKKAGLGLHVSLVHNVSSKHYYDQYFKKEGEGLCKTCRKETHFQSIPEGYRDHCSRKCMMQSEERKKIRASYSPWPKGRKRTKESVEKTASKLRNRPKSEEFKAHLSKYWTENPNHPRYWKGKKRGPLPQQHRDNIRKGLLNVVGKIRINSTRRRIEQSCFPMKGKNEDAFFVSLQSIPCSFTSSKELEGFIVDVFIEELNLAIEFDEQYHFSSPIQTIRDHNRMLVIFQKTGCRFIRIEENDWIQNKKEVLTFISKTIEEFRIGQFNCMVCQKLFL